jgi:hypothetical protein
MIERRSRGKPRESPGCRWYERVTPGCTNPSDPALERRKPMFRITSESSSPWRVGLVSVLALLLLLTAAPAWSDEPEGGKESEQPERGQRRQPGPSLDGMMTFLTEELSLTEEQVPEVRLILEDRRLTMANVREELGRPETPEDTEVMRERMREVTEQTNQRLAEVLDEEQMKGYQELGQRFKRNHIPQVPPALDDR